MAQITFYKHDPIPLEMHKVRIVQKLNLLPTAQRLQKMKDSGYNTFQLHNSDIFLDMLTDSGVNAMSDDMESAMLRADDAYAGSKSCSASNTVSLPTRAGPVRTSWPPGSSSRETASS